MSSSQLNCNASGYAQACVKVANEQAITGAVAGATVGRMAGGPGLVAGALGGAAAGATSGCAQGLLQHRDACNTLRLDGSLPSSRSSAGSSSVGSNGSSASSRDLGNGNVGLFTIKF